MQSLKEIKEQGKEDDLMEYLEECFPDGADAVELNDLLAYDWEWVYSQIGMPLDAYDDLNNDNENPAIRKDGGVLWFRVQGSRCTAP